MSKIADDIKKEFEAYKEAHLEHLKENVGLSMQEIIEIKPHPNAHAPFEHEDFWMYYYLFPEALMLAEEYIEEKYNKYALKGKSKLEFTKVFTFYKELHIYPCWVIDNGDILRIMEEIGIRRVK